MSLPLPCSSQKTWCVAKPSTEEAALQENIDFACSHVDCGVLRSGCACSAPNTRINHASVAMNLYYEAMGRNHWNCHFGNSGLIVQTDPSNPLPPPPPCQSPTILDDHLASSLRSPSLLQVTAPARIRDPEIRVSVGDSFVDGGGRLGFSSA